MIDKVFAIMFPISAFVASDFERSIANMYFLPLGIHPKDQGGVVKAAAPELAHLGVGSAAANILSATLGNIVGGAFLVGLVYWFVYLWCSRADRPSKV